MMVMEDGGGAAIVAACCDGACGADGEWREEDICR